ncbi:MAG: nucleotidyltransferase family protein [Acidimicrobiales bacterium]
MTTAAVVLAAGPGSRFTGPMAKLLAPFRGRPLVAWAVGAAAAALLDETVVVWGAVDLAAAGLPPGITLVSNPGWSGGLATSLQVAVAHAGARGHDAVVVGLGDQPLVTASAWRSVAVAAGPVAVATYGGRRSHPVRLAREVWPSLPTVGDAGARRLVAGNAGVVEVACAGGGPGPPADIDTAEDLARWT